MIPGAQTHIEAWTDPDELRFIYAHHARAGRIAAMECSVDTMLSNVADNTAAGLTSLVTLADPERIRLLAGLNVMAVECRNEDDGDLSPWSYREILDQFCFVGLTYGVPIAGPTCSNTNRKCVRWASSVRGDGWPDGMRYLSWHSYDPHENMQFAEMERLANGLPIIISEFGYPSLAPVTEDEQAAKATQLWPIYQKYHAAFWFQMHDGPNQKEREHCYGLRRMDGGWKPVAYTIPQQETQMVETDVVIREQNLIPLDGYGKPGKFSAYATDSHTGVVAVDDQGNVWVHGLDTIGQGYETFSRSKDGTVAVFDESGPMQRGIRIV